MHLWSYGRWSWSFTRISHIFQEIIHPVKVVPLETSEKGDKFRPRKSGHCCLNRSCVPCFNCHTLAEGYEQGTTKVLSFQHFKGGKGNQIGAKWVRDNLKQWSSSSSLDRYHRVCQPIEVLRIQFTHHKEQVLIFLWHRWPRKCQILETLKVAARRRMCRHKIASAPIWKKMLMRTEEIWFWWWWRVDDVDDLIVWSGVFNFTKLFIVGR